jgi:hypothetical protein
MCRPPEISQITLNRPYLSAGFIAFAQTLLLSLQGLPLEIRVKLSKRESQEIVELYYEDVLTKLDDDQVKPSFSNFNLLDSSQRSGCNPKTGGPHYCSM